MKLRLDKHGQPQITEKAFQATVIKALKITGWEFYHTFDSRRSVRGFPDLVCLHAAKKKAMAIEIKTETGKLTTEQDQWLALFSLCGIESWLLRPSMFDEFWEAIK